MGGCLPLSFSFAFMAAIPLEVKKEQPSENLKSLCHMLCLESWKEIRRNAVNRDIFFLLIEPLSLDWL